MTLDCCHRDEQCDAAISWRTFATGSLRHSVPRNDKVVMHRPRDDILHSIKPNTHTLPPAGTLSVMNRPATLPPRPESTATYCLPLYVYVIGGAFTEEPVLNFQSCCPLSWSSATTSPVRS